MKTSSKIIFILVLLFIVIFAVIFFRSPVSKISQIQIEGNVFSSREEILSMSGLEVGSPFFGASASDIVAILEVSSLIAEATVDKQFPGTISILIEEYDTVAYELAADGQIHALLSSGASVNMEGKSISVDKPVLTHWETDDPMKTELTNVLKEIPNELTSDISEILPSPTPSFPDRIKLYTKTQFEVITTISLLEDKVSYLNQVIETEEPGRITMLEADSYEPFIPEDEEAGEDEAESTS